MTLQVLVMSVASGGGTAQLSALRHSDAPDEFWLCCMELHAQVLCPALATLPRPAQLSKKASFRQDLGRLRLPYRLATRPELDAIKRAGQLSVQAPSAMLMLLADAVRLLNEKGEKEVRRQVVRQCRLWLARPLTAKILAPDSLAQPPPVQAAAIARPKALSGRGARKNSVEEAVRALLATAAAASLSPARPPVPVLAVAIEPDDDDLVDVNIVQSSLAPTDSDDESSGEAEILSAAEWWKMWNASPSSAAAPASAAAKRKNSIPVAAGVLATPRPLAKVPVPRTPTSDSSSIGLFASATSPQSRLSMDIRSMSLSLAQQTGEERGPLRALLGGCQAPPSSPSSSSSSVFQVSPRSAFTPVRKRGRKNFDLFAFDSPFTPTSHRSTPMPVVSPLTMPRAPFRAMSLSSSLDDQMRKRLKHLR